MAPRRSTPKGHAARASRRLHHESLEKRELLAADIAGPRLISVAANSGENFNLLGDNQLAVAPQQLTFRFDGGQEIDASTLSGIKIFGSGGDGSFSEGNEVEVVPGFLGLGDTSRIVIARFSSDLPDDQYRISISGFDQTDQGLVALRNINQEAFQPTGVVAPTSAIQEVQFNVEVGPRVVGVVPQPIVGTGSSRTQLRDTIQVFFNNDPLGNPGTPLITSTGSTTDPAVVQFRFYNLFFTKDTVETNDDGLAFQPTRITYEPALRRATLTFENDLSLLTPVDDVGGSGTFRLRIGSSQALPVSLAPVAEGVDAGDTFAGSRDLGISFGGGNDSSVIVSGEIEPVAGNTIQWPGIDAPALRDDRRDAQVTGRADTIDGINVYFYNFADAYGLDNSSPPQVLDNAITPAQKQRAREILDLYSQYLGVQFIETEDRGLQIVTGDLRPLVETATTGPGAPFQDYRVNDEDPTKGVLILDAGENWYDGYGLSPDPNQPSWFVEALRGIGNLLGIGNTFEQVPGVASGSNPLLYDASLFGNPANFTIEPDFLSTSDIVPGQALLRPEIRDADLYQFSVSERGRISVETFAQRMLETSTLNTDLKLWKFNPTSGEFDLVARNNDFYGDDSFVGVDVDRNADGSAALYVIGITADGNDDYNPNIAGSGGGGRSQGRYDMRITFESSTVPTITDTNGSRLDGDSDGIQGGDFNFWFRTARTKDTAAAGEARTLFVNSSGGLNNVNGGTIAAPYRSVAFAFSQAREGDIVRLLPDGGTDGRIDTTFDNVAYEIGRGGTGNAVLKDGETFEVPKGVTVMIDAGAILKLRNAKISVGSESIDDDRSLAALQILGAPFIVDQGGAVIDGKVDITSFNEERRDGVLFGIDNNPIPTTAGAGDWAGIEFRNDVDYSEGRGVWETEGIFLDYVSHADIRFGGGSVSLTAPSVAPLQMAESRPTLIYNHISDSRQAAISADPDSFAETNFHAPLYQQAAIDRFGTTFTSDYDRVGPLIRGNALENNSSNSLFVRVDTPAVGERVELTVSGRFDDRDIVHSLSEVLVLQGNPGGPELLEQRPDVLGVSVAPSSITPPAPLAPSVRLTTGRVVDYRITFVNGDGYESLASEPTRSATVGSNGAISLSNLPAASSEFTGRKLYRLTTSGAYEFVTLLDRATPTYTDNGTTRGGLLRLAAIPETSAIAVSSPIGSVVGSLTPGTNLNYRFTYVTSDGLESLADAPTSNVLVNSSGTVVLGNPSSTSLNRLPSVPAEFAGLNVYRLAGADYELVTQLPAGQTVFTDDGTLATGILLSTVTLGTAGAEKLLPRIDSRLSIDPGIVVKLDSARIEATFGADFYAEGTDGNPVVFTSRLDDRYGAGGTFDTNNDGSHDINDPLGPKPGDWSGLIFRQGSSASIDNAVISFGGGESELSGNFVYFNPIEILQADVRIAHSTIANNASGTLSGTVDYSTRDGIGFNGPATIYVRGAQPVIVENTITDNEGAAISVNPDSLNYLSVSDPGRSTGIIDRFVGDADNQGPLVEANRLDRNDINGMLVRNEALTTESVWDDTDIVHVVERSVIAWNQHQRSGLRLKSDPNQSLVVKFQTAGSLIADRYRTDIADSIGGTIQVIGQPGFPVVLTSLSDDTVGAGFTPSGLPQNDTDNLSGVGNAGDWRGIIINPGSNDRNVAFVPEAERAVGTAAAVNAIPATAQLLGSLAQNEVSADENRRLGFNVRGTLSQNSDIDVYSFTANGGTEVFFDIDDTDFGLDTVVEVIDVNGNILALSDSSNRESVNPSLLVNNIAASRVLPLRKDGEASVENPNALDAGMRVVMPGNSATVNQYFVRVRSSNLAPGASSSNLTNTSLVGAGRSSGQYQLSIRLRETDEIAGTTVRLSDIRFATTAIDVPAAPNNSPLASEHAEELTETGLDLNDGGTAFANGQATAQFANGDADPLGSLASSERGVLRVTGVLGNQIPVTNTQFGFLSEADIDVYRIDLRADSLEPNIIGENRFVSTVFDIDYADQLGRANTSIAVYDAAGRVILHSRDSNIADDQGRPTLGGDSTNLSAGSAGTLDAFIGPVEMQVGTYYVVVSSSQMIPSSLNQLFSATPTDATVRILPIDSVRNIAQEGFTETNLGTPSQNFFSTASSEFQSLNTTADLPTITPFFDETSIVPYKLEDVRLFVTLDQGLSGNNNTTLITVDPFTGQLERTIGQFAQPTGDLAIRRDGELFAYSLGPASGNQDNGNTGNFLNVSSANAAVSNSGDDGLTFQRNNAAGTDNEADDASQLLINAIAFVPQSGSQGVSFGNNPAIPDTERAFVVGNRDSFGRGELPNAFAASQTNPLGRNIMYSVVANSGAATNQGSTNGQLDRDFGGTAPYREQLGTESNKVELGVVDTGQFPDSPLPPDGPYPDDGPFGSFNGTRFVNYPHDGDGGDITGIAMDPQSTSSLVYAVTDTGYVFSYNPNSRRTVDVDPTVIGSYNQVINTTNFGQVTPHPDDTTSINQGFVSFASLTLGPRLTESDGTTALGPYARTLFGVTSNGWIYTMTLNTATNRVEPAHVLFNGNYAIPITSEFGGTLFVNPVGVAFSTREENLWHDTGDRGTDVGHGIVQPPDQSRVNINGGTSLYFGNEIDGTVTNNTLDGGNGTLNPGGAHGSTVSKPFSLEGYSAGDKPTLYFNYFLEVEANDDSTRTRQQVDSFRVFATGDDGQWRLVSTNDSFREFVNTDQYDEFANNGGIPVQELYDDAGVWRQARVDLSPLAGNKNVQLRFDFSTAGGMQSQFTVGPTGYLTEIQATAGTDVIPGSTFTLQDNTFTTFSQPTFEFVRGAAVQIPAGTAILDGQQLQFTNTAGTTTTVTLTTDPLSTAVNPILFSRTDTATMIAASIETSLNTLDATLVATATGADLRVSEASSFTLTPERFGGSALTIPDADPTLVGKSLQFTNLVGKTTSVSLQTSQQVQFGNGTETITVTANVPGFANGVSINFVDRFNGFVSGPDVPATATFSNARRAITVNYNSDPLATPTFNDFNAIANAINNLANFNASVSPPLSATPFTPPSARVFFPTDEIYIDPINDTGAILAQRIATKLNSFDTSLGAVASGDQLILTGASTVPVSIPTDVASLDGTSLAFTLQSGSVLTLTLTTSTTPTFFQVGYDLTDTPADIALAVANRINVVDGFFGATLGATAVGDQVIVPGIASLSLDPAFTAATINPISFNVGATASQYLPSGNVPIFYAETMSMQNVRDAIREAFVNGLGNQSAASGVSTATIANFPEYGTNRIRIYNWSQFNDTTSLGFSNFLPGDEFGEFGSRSISSNQINTRAGSNNAIQGVYIDDIVVGFAERGEVVLNAPSDRSFEVLPEQRTFSFNNLQQPEYPNEILVGSYTLEVRTGAEYGVPEDYDPIRLQLNEQFGFGRSFDTNDRLDSEAVTLIAPSGNDLQDGDLFVLSNGTQQVTFEFDSAGGVTSGRVRVPFTAQGTGTAFSSSSNEDELVARAIRDAINSPQAFNVLGIYAAGRDSNDAGVMTGNRIELFGDSIQVNPSSGRFIKVDLVKEETFYGRESARTLPIVDHLNNTVQDQFFYDTFARATVTEYVNGNTDTLVADGKVGDHVATDDANVLLPSDPTTDVDIVKIFLNAGDTIDVDLDTVGWALGTLLDSSSTRELRIPQGNVAGLDGQTVSAQNAAGVVTTITLTLNAPTNTNEVQFFTTDDSINLAVRIGQQLFNLDPSLNVSFGNFSTTASSLVLFSGEFIGFGTAFSAVSSGSLIQIYDESQTLQTDSSAFSSMATGEKNIGAWIDNFTAPTSGYYYVAVGTNQLASSFFFNSNDGYGEYQLTIRPGSAVPRDVIMVDYHFDNGDTNRFRDQGQYIIESNFIRDFSNVGINATFNTNVPDNDGNFSSVPIDRRPGAATTLRNANTERLLPGTVISNNVVIASGGTGIVFFGETAAGGNSPAPVPFGRIVNNTVVGTSGIGISIGQSASPTVLNNIVTGFTTGVNIDASSTTTIEGGNAYQNNGNASNRPIAASSINIASNIPLFQDPAGGVYIPASGSAVIDSSFASLGDRSTFVNTVKQPVGIASSPIIAPVFDAYGIPRFDDPTVKTPGGVGSNVFIDRGAIDRADFVRPLASLVSPLDFIAGTGVTIVGGDADPSESFVRLISGSLEFFEVQLFDLSGSGPDPRTITEDSVILTENGIGLTPGVDYTFGYSANSRLIRLTPLAGLWRPDAVYDITLNNEDRVGLTLPSGDQITDGDYYTITDKSTPNRTSVFEFDSGYVLQVPQTLGFEVLGANTAFNDGDTFTIALNDTLGNLIATRTFEINRAGTVRSGNIPVNIGSPGDGSGGIDPITLQPTSIGPTIESVRDAIVLALQSPSAAALNLAPRALGTNRLQIGSLSGHTITGTVAGLTTFGTDAGVVPGDQFRYTTASGATALFEFTSGLLPVISSSAVPIQILRTDSVDDVSAKVASAVASQALGLTDVRAVEDGRILLGGRPTDTLTIIGIDNDLQVVGQAGVTGKLTLTVPPTTLPTDLLGSTFTVRNGSEVVTFEFATDPLTPSANRLVILNPNDTAAGIAAAIAAEVDAGIVSLTNVTASVGVVSLNEQNAIIPTGTAQVLASITLPIGSPLLTGGVSGGAIAVPFLPTSEFSPSSAATSLVTAIGTSPLALQSFSPGGGTLLFTGVQNVILTDATGATTLVGVAIPAISDLAQNPVDSNRDDDETRFTIIMPEVRFDFGDAPNTYGTLLAQNGARHAISGGSTLVLGSFVDGEADGQPSPASDDARLSVSAVPSSSTFVRDATDPFAPRITLSATPAIPMAPAGGDKLSVTIGSKTSTFELITSVDNAASGNIAVTFSPTEPLADITLRVLNAIRAEFVSVAGGVLFSIDPLDGTTFVLQSIDDEDGIATGVFTPATGAPLRVFTSFGASAPIAESDVTGFINPLDPAGTNFQVAVLGTGLLDVFVDFNRDGDFNDPGEKAVSNASVTNGINTLTLFAPSGAGSVDGDTWMRLRLSEGGNLGPGGVAIGGEVEDHQISIRSVAPAIPVSDSYTTNEDTFIDSSLSSSIDSLSLNDLNLSTQLITPSVYLAQAPANGTVTINPVTGDFRYTPNPDFNGIDTFTYRLGTQPTASAESLAVATLGTVTITVNSVNDAPTFTAISVSNLLEDSGTGTPKSVTISNVITGAIAGPITAIDEVGDNSVTPAVPSSQTVTISLNAAGSTIPTGLFSQPAVVTQTTAADGSVSASLTVFPADNAYGTAVYSIDLTDNGAPAGVSNTRVTVNVRPVNDAPQADQTRLGETNNAGPDNVYTIADGSNPNIAAGTLIFTFKEDGGPYFLPLRQANSGLSFSRIGLLDPFLAGPANETLIHDGGPQQLLLSRIGGVAVGASSFTGANGTLTPVVSGGTLIGYDYTPPVDLNSSIASFDEFSYVVIDQNGSNPLDPEGYTDPNGLPVNGPLTATNRVILILNPVNDTPLFTLPETLVTVPEDAATFTQDNFAINIFAGPQLSAFDEVDVTTGQNVTFSVTSITFPQNQSSQFFTRFPTISPEGTLQFQPAPDVFGQFVFEVVLSDDGPDNSTRGDDISSDPVTITINVLPVNDAPARVPGVNNLAYTLLEDGSFDVPVQGPTTAPGLLNLFNVGPTNEAANILPLVGGNQTLTLDQIPASTTNGGTLTPVTNQSGQLVSLRYRPRANYVGTDSFIYSVIDNGVTVSIDGQTLADPRRAFATVSFTVTPVNDAPLFSGGSSVVSQEDPTPATTTITNWVTNVQAGPLGANDESNQILTFEFTQIGGPTDLLITGPTATIVGTNANLTYTSAPDANGLLTFTVRLRDNGAAGQGNIDVSPAQTFTIRVNPVNDPPSFVPGSNVLVQEDSGAYRETWATSVSPGPADERAVPQTVSFDVTTDTASQALFQTLPTIDSDGVLQFIPAANASGVATVNVVARDSAGAVSSSVTLQITIEEVNDAPTAVPDSVTTDEDRILTFNASQLLANDTDPDLATNPNEVLSVVLPAQQFSVSGARVSYNSTTGVITYDPTGSDAIQSLAPGQTLTDSFAYRVRDNDGLESSPVTVSLRVDGINDAPRLVADNPTLNPNGSTTIRPLDNDSDVDGTINPASLTITLQPAFGSLTITPGGVLTYTPFSTFSGEDVFRYTVADNLGQQSPEATVVVSSNAAPTAANDAGGTFREEDVLINVAANDRDFDGTLNLASIQIVTQPTRGEAIPQSNGTVRYVPGLGFTGLDSFTYTIADNEGRRSQAATVQLQVVGSRLQNPAFDRNSDVSDDGLITAIDALLVINRLNVAQNDGTLVNGGVPVTDADRGPFYYDVNGDGRITASDALEVLRILNLRDALGQGGTSASGEGEFMGQSDRLSPTQVSTSGQATDPVATTLWEDGKVRVDSFVSEDDLTSLAMSLSDSDKDTTQTNESAIDAVLRLFS